MRTNKELIKIAIDNFDLFSSGLCMYFNVLYGENILSIDEARMIGFLVKRNIKDFVWYKPYFIEINKGGYYWEKGLKEPRLKYLDYLLNKYENENT